MNPIIKNLLHVIRRFKLATTLNILGLSVAFAAFMIIMMQLQFSFGFDRFHKNSDKIFRVETISHAAPGYLGVLSRPLATAIFESSPHIVAGAITNSFILPLVFQVENEGVLHHFNERGLTVTPEFTDVFAFDFVEGTADALRMPQHAMIPLSLAQRLFGNESAIGRHLIVNQNTTLTVGAVFRDFPNNTIVENVIHIGIPPEQDINSQVSRFATFIRVTDASVVPTLFENFKRTFNAQAAWGEDFCWDETGFRLRFTALPEIHFTSDVRLDRTANTNRQVLFILLAVGIAIIVIAAINFTNFSTALAPMRIKNINIQRVLGAQQHTMQFTLISEAVAFSLVSSGIALLLVYLFANSELANLMTADLSFSAQPLIIGGTALVALLVGLLAGAYPARYMTSFEPALTLKGNFALSPAGRKLRNTLIGIQFVASFALIIGTSFMFLQNRFIQNSDLGFDRDALIITNIGRIPEHRDAIVYQLKTHPTIENVTFAEMILGSFEQHMSWGRQYNGEQIGFQFLRVHYNFLEVMGIELAEGRHFRQEDAYSGAFIFNEAARRQFGFELNSVLEPSNPQDVLPAAPVIGFVPDIKFASFRSAIEPAAFFVGDSPLGRQTSQTYIQLTSGANLREAMTHVRRTLADFSPGFPFEIRFFDEVLQRTYESERNLSMLILIFSLIAIFISIVGVFGLVVFDSECRRKEIGIRKVLGSSTGGIILMFNKAYFKILVICFVIAVPIAWFTVNRWLENFAYRTPMYWWVYVLALVAISAITVLTVTIQNWRVANDDPVKSIKTG